MPPQRALCRLALLALLLGGLPGAAQAEAEDVEQREAREKLEQLQGEIARISAEISSDNARKDSLQQQLREAEVELGRLQTAMADNERAIAASTGELSDLQQQRTVLEQARSDQQARIALELKTAWQLGQQSQIRVLLNQENPHTVARVLAYYRYFFQARNQLVADYRETLRQLQELELRIAGTLEQLAGQQATLGEQQAQLVEAQATREQAVAQLSEGIDSKAERLAQMEQDRKELESLLAAIEKALAELEVPADYQPFESARGEMPWPLAGRRANTFGRARNEGKMRWQGVSIPAAEGASVQAIHHGRVVYADWLRGSGLLLIIDHGDGYMSLYANNQSLLREVGEWVNAGTPVSTAGNTGGQEESGLYFEIRHHGKPTDPARWCKD
ncbi:MAG: peptidoglycan DD-metalloendopeptidase family protein [Halioglobus sp.]|nr:peptidoglycan DD-metalloendopeptidase family protein [Halioglobus sp.]